MRPNLGIKSSRTSGNGIFNIFMNEGKLTRQPGTGNLDIDVDLPS